VRVLVACEFSGAVRRAFRERGHDAWSCDLLPAADGGQHIQGNALYVANNMQWDLMIAHPPCTHLAVSGARWFRGKETEQAEALDFVHMLLSANIPKICLENPVSIISTHIRKPDQIIQPYQFVHDASKTTCLWLKGLPKLVSTQYVEPRIVKGKARWANQCDSGQNKLGPSDNRWALRSETYSGVAKAMSEQWG